MFEMFPFQHKKVTAANAGLSACLSIVSNKSLFARGSLKNIHKKFTIKVILPGKENLNQMVQNIKE